MPLRPEGRSRRPPATARATGCGSSPRPPRTTLLQRRCEPALWFVQHGPGGSSTTRSGTSPRLGGGVRRGEQAFADAVLEELEGEPDATVSSTNTTCTWRPRSSGAAARRRSRISPTFRGWSRSLVGAARPIVTAIHSGLLANDVVGFHTERWRDAFLRAAASWVSIRRRARHGASDLDRPDEFTGLAESDGVLVPERELVAFGPRR